MAGNKKLVEYGITGEQSDIRAHVCVNAGRVYAYRTERGMQAIQTGEFRAVPVFLEINGERVQTAQGYLVPPGKIRGCRTMLATELIKRAGFKDSDSETVKGEKAQWVVRQLVAGGRFPLPGLTEVVTDKAEQIAGVDLYAYVPRLGIQVKCDWRGGEPIDRPRVTGNLFLQTHECNYHSKT